MLYRFVLCENLGNRRSNVQKPAFVEENKCVLPTAPLSTSLCQGNKRNPTREMKRELRLGCKKAACRELLGEDTTVVHPVAVA